MVQVSWSALSVGFLALYFAFSLNQASSNGVEDTDECENLQPIYDGALLLHVYQTLKVPSSIYCVSACDNDIRCQSINHVVHGEICELNNRTKEAKPEYFTDDHTKFTWRSSGRSSWLDTSWRQYHFFPARSLFLKKIWCGVGLERSTETRYYRALW